jgi:tRNA(adenine34) deaminase
MYSSYSAAAFALRASKPSLHAGEWPHRRCSAECHNDWEEEEGGCVHGQWEVAGDQRLVSGRWDDDDVNGGEHCCRECGQRKGYNGGDPYSGRRRERRDVDGYRGNYRDSDRRRQLWRDYHDDEEEGLDLRRRMQSRGRRDMRELDSDDTVDTRMVGTRRYNDDVRKYDRRRESRDLDYDDAVDVRRAGRYAEDARRFDWRIDSRDFEIDDEVYVRRERREA